MKNAGENVVRIEAEALRALADRIAGPMARNFNRAVDLLYSCQGRVVVTGMGKSGIIARKIAATLSSIGTPALFMHPVEALHGDLGMVVRGDVVLGSLSQRRDRRNSPPAGDAETSAGAAHRHDLRRDDLRKSAQASFPPRLARPTLLSIAPSPKKPVPWAWLQPPQPPPCSRSAMPWPSCFPRDAASKRRTLPISIPEASWASKLARVESLMHSGDAVPRVTPQTKMPDVIYEMSRKKLGVTAVVEGEKLVGIISDGDLRRLLEKRGKDALDLTAAESMTTNPRTISPNEFAAAALALMEEKKITSLAVVNGTAICSASSTCTISGEPRWFNSRELGRGPATASSCRFWAQVRPWPAVLAQLHLSTDRPRPSRG